MISLLTSENVCARQDGEPFGESASLESLYRMPAGKALRNKTRLRRQVIADAGTLMSVDVTIQLIAGHTLKPSELGEIVRHCCSRYFEYALSTSHAKTILCELDTREGRPVGDLTATFLPASLERV
jgi:hypothetical protein